MKFCCELFKKATEDNIIINQDNSNGPWNPPVKYGEWYLSSRDYNPYQESYEYEAVLIAIKYCPWCRRKTPIIS